MQSKEIFLKEREENMILSLAAIFDEEPEQEEEDERWADMEEWEQEEINKNYEDENNQ